MIDLDFKLGLHAGWDSTQTKGDIVFVEGAKEVSQSSKVRLLFIHGEQFDDTRVGTPWLTDLTSTLVSISVKREIIRRIVFETQGVKTIDNLEVELDTKGGLKLNWSGKTKSNEFFKGGN